MKKRNFDNQSTPPKNPRLEKEKKKQEETKIIRIDIDTYNWIKTQAFFNDETIKDYVSNMVDFVIQEKDLESK